MAIYEYKKFLGVLGALFVSVFPAILVLCVLKFCKSSSLLVFVYLLSMALCVYILRKWQGRLNASVLRNLVSDLNRFSKVEDVKEKYAKYVFDWEKKQGKGTFYVISFSPPQIFYRYNYYFIEKLELDHKSGEWKLCVLQDNTTIDQFLLHKNQLDRDEEKELKND